VGRDGKRTGHQGEVKIWNAQGVMSSDPDATEGRDGAPRVNRLLTLSDGVIAIALTLLVLQLRVPALDQVPDPDSAKDLAAQLGNGSAQLVSYGISFSAGAGGRSRPRKANQLRDLKLLLPVDGASAMASRSCSPSPSCRSPAPCSAPS